VLLEEVQIDSERTLSILPPSAIKVTINNPGTNRLEALVSALKRARFECRIEAKPKSKPKEV
jgi:hypothetical protein